MSEGSGQPAGGEDPVGPPRSTGDPPAASPTGAGTPATATSRPPAPPSDVGDTSRLLDLIKTAVPLVTTFTALLVYFGWSYSNAKAARLGFDTDLLDQSTRTLVVSSANTILRPMLVVLALAFVWLEARAVLRRRIRAESAASLGSPDETSSVRTAVVVTRLLFASAAAVLVAALVTYVAFGETDRDVRTLGPWYYRHLIPPLALALITLLVVEGIAASNRIHPDQQGRSPWERTATQAAVWAVLALCAFWSVAVYARISGLRDGNEIAASLRDRVQVVVYSPEGLHLVGDGIVETRIEGADLRYRYRYEGLRLLHRSGGRLTLAPVGWSTHEGRVIVLPDDDTLRFEYLIVR